MPWISLLVSLGLQILVVYLPSLQQAFTTTALSPGDWLLCLVASSGVLWLREVLTFGRRLRREHRSWNERK